MAGKQTPSQKTSPPGDLTPLELHACVLLARDAPEWREHLEAGRDQRVDFSIHVAGWIDVGPEQISTRRKAPDAETILACVLACLGPHTKTAEKVCAFLRGGTKKLPQPEEIPLPARAAAKDVLAALTTETVEPRHGNLTGNLEYRRLGRLAAVGAARHAPRA